MKYWTISIWPDYNLSQNEQDDHINLLKVNDYDGVIIFCEGEMKFNSRIYRLDDIINIAKERHIKIYAIIGCDQYYNPNFLEFSNDIEIQWWPTFFFNRGVKGFAKEAAEQKSENVIISDLNNLNYKFHFVYLNNRFSRPRAMMIDQLVKNDLLKYSAYSWHDLKSWKRQGVPRALWSKETKKSFPKHDPYELKYYDGAKKELDGQYITAQESRFPLPNEYYQTFFQLVTETITDVKFITEKTTAPLFIGKPFIILGGSGIHQLLKNLGFELYNELFDYSFDSIINLGQRIDGICHNIKQITDLSLDECKNLNSKIQDKVNHNRKRIIEIAYDQNFMPKLANLAVQHYYETGEILDKELIDTTTGLSDIRLFLEKYKNL